MSESAINIPRAGVDLDAEGYGPKHFVPRKEKSVGAMRLKIVQDDPRGYTHKLKSQSHFWEGTEEDFREHFDPASGAEKKAAAVSDDEAKAEIEAARKRNADKKAADKAAKEAAKKAGAADPTKTT